VLFNSYIFLFAFLPAALSGYFLAGRLGRRAAAVWLLGASFVFYGWWNPAFLPVLLVSIAFNYAASEVILRVASRPGWQAGLLAGAIATNISALFYYKYLVAVLLFFGVSRPLPIALPLGISFFTFTQIGYLVDVAQGVAKDRGLLSYMQFVTFFPHLIAGPILHNREIMPQFTSGAAVRFSASDFAVGSAIFIIGLLKKCLLADPTAAIAAPGFAHPAAQGFFSAWHAALAYSLQLYFDFSGYSDMAIGLARLFGIRFPLNFNSPYKAASIIDYWQRWHMTLSRYLNLYLYNPVALAVARHRIGRGRDASRKAYRTAGGFAALVALPTMFTMFLAGIWHGAGLQFLVFGLLHAGYLTVNHAWRVFGPKAPAGGDVMWVHTGKIALTYVSVLVAAVFFRASSCAAAMDLLGGMVGMHGLGVAAPAHEVMKSVAWLSVLYGIVWFMPNTQQIMRDYAPALGRIQAGPFPALVWRPSLPWAMAAGAGAALGVLALGGTTEFLYFQF
jgi:D-alanyl-lipoteichoic acid acyltransferase DltB (MBOAT superfamily)